jgi:hypothetical protein
MAPPRRCWSRCALPGAGVCLSPFLRTALRFDQIIKDCSYVLCHVRGWWVGRQQIYIEAACICLFYASDIIVFFLRREGGLYKTLHISPNYILKNLK